MHRGERLTDDTKCCARNFLPRGVARQILERQDHREDDGRQRLDDAFGSRLQHFFAIVFMAPATFAPLAGVADLEDAPGLAAAWLFMLFVLGFDAFVDFAITSSPYSTARSLF